MNENSPLAGTEISLRTAGWLTGKNIKTMQRWCDEQKIAARIVDARGKKLVPLAAVLPYTVITAEHAELVQQAEAGDAEALNEIGIVLLHAGKAEIAFIWFEMAAKSQHADALHMLAKYYLSGDMGVARNEDLGLSMLAAAAAQGHAIAKVQIGALK